MKLLHRYFLTALLFWSNVCLNGQYYLYDNDCLDFYATDYPPFYSQVGLSPGSDHQIIPFCRGDSFEDGQLIATEFEIPSLTFEELKKRNISSFELYKWSIHMDLVEEYQAFRENKTGTETVTSDSLIYNCSSINKFGQYCQYSFNTQMPFNTIVKSVLKRSPSLASNGTCYLHLNCKRNSDSWCLDWREVCDGKVDCWPDPVDEQHCEKLEQNECAPNEYRCFNGQCIPEIFLLDKTFVSDCLDRTDEDLSEKTNYAYICKNEGDPSFRCTDTMCHHWSFSTDVCTMQLCGAPYCRDKLIEKIDYDLLLPTANAHINEKCWAFMICLIQAQQRVFLNGAAYAHLFNVTCDNVCQKPNLPCNTKMIEYCPPLFEFPAMPIGWSQVHFVYSWNRTNIFSTLPHYICYDERHCAINQSNIRFAKLSDPSTILSCELSNTNGFRGNWLTQISFVRNYMHKQCSSTTNGKENNCLANTQFQCGNKCLSKHRLLDLLHDCPDSIDEEYNNSCALNQKHRLKCTSYMAGIEITQCLPNTNIWFGKRNDCKSKVKLPHFPTLCDGYKEYDENINGQIETDETNCEEWQCDNQYTRCNGVWNCRNGADEAQCFHSICNGSHGHPCLLLNTKELICLPTANVSDGIVDCVGATDEQQACRNLRNGKTGYRCLTNSTDNKQIANETKKCIDQDDVCNEEFNCPLHDDELVSLCKNGDNSKEICNKFWEIDRRLTKENIICSLDDFRSANQATSGRAPHFSLANYSILPPIDLKSEFFQVSKRALSTNVEEHNEWISINQLYKSLTEYQCHGGIPIYFKNEIKCLCPPILYGLRCENQNQRISVTLKIGAPEWRTAFVLIIYLLDDVYGIINSYHQIQYLSIRDNNTKFNFHLLYSSRPKLSDQTYSIRIDVYEMATLKYRTSWLFPILFPFLPVYRLPIQLTVPFVSISSEIDCPLKCQSGHGRCVSFINTGKYFCLCQPGWSGPLCSNSHKCNCSPGSICVGTWKNKSICVCPTHKFGRRCYLKNDLCEQSNARNCSNGGQCIPRDIRIPIGEPTICSCPHGFHGDTCQLNETRIDILIAMPDIKDFISLHFITVNSHIFSYPYFPSKEWGPHERATTFKRIPFDNNEVTIYWQNRFHLIFVEYDYNIYLLVSQLSYTTSVHLKTRLEPDMRCPSIRELLNNTIVNFTRLRRVKYYHIPCQEQPNLKCFHDEDQFICLCTYDRRANCFTFDHHIEYNCQQLFYCKNGGQCFQNSAKSPTSTLCSCPKCYLGTRCQLSTQGFHIPLDIILGYQIRPGISFNNQPLSVKISGIITILMLIAGLINGILSIITFKEKSLCQIGCGIYLFIASIISILTMIILTLKYFSLILIQITMIKNREFLLGQCIIIDFFLKIFLQIGDWLYACVAMERLIFVNKGIVFKTKLSQKMAKWIVIIICIIVIGTSIQEPLNRRLIDDEDEGRIWCIVHYSNFLNLFTSITNLIHFIGPFVINIISAIGIIIMTARNSSNLQKDESLNTHIRNQFHRHKYLIISPIGLIILALPRIILAFQLECMKSARDPAILFLVGYFISFLPLLFLFIVFVLPSRSYRKTFKESILAGWKVIHRWIICKRYN